MLCKASGAASQPECHTSYLLLQVTSIHLPYQLFLVAVVGLSKLATHHLNVFTSEVCVRVAKNASCLFVTIGRRMMHWATARDEMNDSALAHPEDETIHPPLASSPLTPQLMSSQCHSQVPLM
eukprot:TRINITY_DN64715_c0_g1_i2.p1 TRINITY_DN64715_c0_g1~~TRINITY_DN64715_c0_g1_i2.p1  ORF type:complete len:123 (-),score=2.61 TRINITY_DN64715_c0_g1_i2:380-748(-)